MRNARSTVRPWLAALLSAAVAGLGHLYLRRWLRALVWLGVAVAASALVPAAALEAAAAGESVDLWAMAPVWLVGLLCTVDAYLLAVADRRLAHAREAVDDGGRLTRCPSCGGDLDPDLTFCHWCTRDLGDVEVATSATGER
ncbi:zinc ribbon domain-containing protein [Halomarina ordinaria]|uniref:Zinc ribbon domain-containing protein n=1 Tax=Halomarina ordinaria TaxID=3033939 RepID=A0ABD5UFQ2_9EURY|nr:zinc ribbon domain-containing protein [Halomarina sp. PSRA2]